MRVRLQLHGWVQVTASGEAASSSQIRSCSSGPGVAATHSMSVLMQIVRQKWCGRGCSEVYIIIWA